MSDLNALRSEADKMLARPLRLTRWGMAAERFTRAFWPLWSVLFFSFSLLALGVQHLLPGWVVLATLWLAGFGAVVALFRGVAVFRWPSLSDARARLDHSLPGRPLSALSDQQAIGASDAHSRAVWQVHLSRMVARVRQARAVPPDLRLATRDLLGLRYVAATALGVAVLFGSFGQMRDVSVIKADGAALAAGPSWEGWVEPPRYTALPTIYLNDIDEGALSLPQGSRITLRLYGTPGDLTIRQDLSETAPQADAIGQSFDVARGGTLAVDGPGGREWAVVMQPDGPPGVTVLGAPEWAADGEMQLPFAARDDFGVVAGQATIRLDLPQVPRLHGLAVAPEPREPLVLDLPRPLRGDLTGYEEYLIDNLSDHPWAGLPVTISLAVQDARGQQGISGLDAMVLPGRRFFDPLARAIVEQRRDLLWTRDNGPRTGQILRAVSHRPEGLFRDSADYLKLRTAIRQLEAGMLDGLSHEARDEVALALWELALELELGDLDDARERLRRAQERLSEAMRNGANDDEIAALMQELREAMQDYLRQLAEQQQPGDQQMSEMDPNTQMMTADQLQQMMDRIQELMEEGRMAEAQMLMDQLMQMMQNMQLAQVQGGQGPEGQAMQGLSNTLREQQQLSDEAFGQLQERFNPNGRPGEGSQQQGDRPGEGGEGDLAEQQQALRDQLDQQRRQMPGMGGDEAEALRQQLDRAGRAMERAEEKLRQDDLAGALDDQATAMDALREGMRSLSESMAQQQQQQGATGQAQGGQGPMGQRDPLGRDLGSNGQQGGDGEFRRGELADNRARDLMDEIHRRSQDQTRPEAELDYLRRLLEWF